MHRDGDVMSYTMDYPEARPLIGDDAPPAYRYACMVENESHEVESALLDREYRIIMFDLEAQYAEITVHQPEIVVQKVLVAR